MKLHELKLALKNAGIKVHHDMTGPTNSFDKTAVEARTYKMKKSDVLSFMQVKEHTNFAFYQDLGDFLRFGHW